tara:strand:- start:9 stop:326 length:318 start_codon:yes stop_codon:yes gene_type:complete
MSGTTTEKLMNTLINKMESMDNEIISLRRMINSPQAILKKAGFIPVRTPFSEDVESDAFRADTFVKSDIPDSANPDTYSNEEIHDMTWQDIHEMAEQHREVKEMY